MASQTAKRPIRIGGASGGFTDRVAAIRRLASDPGVDAVVGDWLSENVMTGYGAGKERRRAAGIDDRTLPLQERMKTAQYASTFLQCFEPAIPDLMKNKTKLVVNAGANDTELLAEVVLDMIRKHGYDSRVAYVLGDEVTDQFKSMISDGHVFTSVTDGKTYHEWGHDAICAQAYIGSFGITEALREGADIVICGR